jgi:hypothetical protein
MQIEFIALAEDVWNASAKNVKARPVTGKVYVGEILWPQLSRFETATVRAAMLAELAQGQPPMIRNVYERCCEATYGHEPSLSPSGQAGRRNEPAPQPNLFDESRRGDQEYCERRLFAALFCHGLCNVTCQREQLQANAEYAGMTIPEFLREVEAQAQKNRSKRRVPQAVGEVMETP